MTADETVAEARAALCELVERASKGDRYALDRICPALPPHVATALCAHWHYARARRADEERRNGRP